MQSILITNSQIQERITELGKQISQDYLGRDLLLLCVLKSAVVFLADLMRTISIPVRCEFIQLASYNDGTAPSAVKVIQGLTGNLNGADVLIVEDIVDSGHSLNFLVDHIETLKPQSVKVCSLLDKPSRRQVPITVDYLGFEIPDVFVVGYGMDYAQQYRNLPYIKQVSI
jgi:hypoxanthine phosphoribosyltransferase